MFMDSKQKYKYSYARLLIGKINQSQLEFIGGDFKQDQILTIETYLNNGEYLILFEMDWMQNIYKDIVLSMILFFNYLNF